MLQIQRCAWVTELATNQTGVNARRVSQATNANTRVVNGVTIMVVAWGDMSASVAVDSKATIVQLLCVAICQALKHARDTVTVLEESADVATVGVVLTVNYCNVTASRRWREHVMVMACALA